jgi:hypothetical protein
VAATREREVRAHRRDVHDPSRPPLAHGRQDELAHPHEPEDVRLELPAHIGDRDLLDRARLAVSRVVDERVQRPVLRGDRLHRGAHRVLVGDVEREQPAPAGLEIGDRRDVARGGVHRESVRREALGRRPPDAGGAAGDEDALGHGRRL